MVRYHFDPARSIAERRIRHQPLPGYSILLEVTGRCNRACVYCYASDRSKAEDLSASRVEQLLDRLEGEQMPRRITLIGGEPLLLAELEEIVVRIRRRGPMVAVSTNGLDLSPARITSLLRAGVSRFEVSFDSPDPVTYRTLTGTGVGGRQLVLTELRRADVPVTVGAMLTRTSADHVEQLLEVCFALGVQRVSLNQLAWVGEGSRNRSLGCDDQELGKILDRAQACCTAMGLRVGIGLPVEPCRIRHEPYPDLGFERCRCGDGKWLLEPSGDLRTCELAETPVGNLLRTSWQELTRGETAQRFRKQARTERCESCEDWAACLGGCRFRRPERCSDRENPP